MVERPQKVVKRRRWTNDSINGQRQSATGAQADKQQARTDSGQTTGAQTDKQRAKDRTKTGQTHLNANKEEKAMMKMGDNRVPEYSGKLRSHMVEIPRIISKCGGIRIFGRRIKSLVFSTDIAIIRNINADAVIAVYPFTPQPAITDAIIAASDLPVLCGIGGGTTTGQRVVMLASDAEFQGAFGVVLNSPTPNETVKEVKAVIDIPIVVTVVSEKDDISGRFEAGTAILNASAASRTPWVVEKIRKKYPDAAIIATGGPNDQSIEDTINAGANAITWTPPTTGEIFKAMMEKYRAQKI